MRCRAFNYPGAPPQVLGVFWDDEKVASLELKARFMQTSFVVSADRATPGSHRLAFIPAYFGRPERTGHAGRVPKHSRKLSFACDWIALGNGPDAGKARGEGETLWIPAASEVSFFLELEQDLELRWEGVAPRGVVGLDVVWEVEGAVPVTDFITEESAPTLRLPLPPLGEQAAASWTRPTVATLLTGRLARLLREQLELSGRDGVPAPEVEVDEETRRRLQALGYIE